MNEIDVGVDFGITNSDIAIKSDKSVSYKTLSSEKNIHLSLKNIIKNLQSNSGLKNFGLINASRSVLFPKNSYLVDSIEEWQDMILKELEKTNDILINTKT